jgi:hypothetical protein
MTHLYVKARVHWQSLLVKMLAISRHNVDSLLALAIRIISICVVLPKVAKAKNSNDCHVSLSLAVLPKIFANGNTALCRRNVL